MGHAGSRHKRRGSKEITDANQLLSEELVSKVSTEEIESLEELFHSLSVKKDKDESISFEAFQGETIISFLWDRKTWSRWFFFGRGHELTCGLLLLLQSSFSI